jgi:transposase
MTRFIEGKDRRQTLLLPESLDEYVTTDNPVRVIDAFVDALDLLALGFAGARPAATGRPAYHPATLLRIYLYGYLHRVPSSRRLEQETRRNLELIWLTGQLTPDVKTIADFRRHNAEGIRAICTQFVVLCRGLGLCWRPWRSGSGTDRRPCRSASVPSNMSSARSNAGWAPLTS